jgi:hypothetical protein
MRAVIKGAVLAALLAGSSLAGTAPAQARDRHDGTGVAIAAGIIGLGIGAAIASDHRGYEQADYGYDYAPSAYYAESPAYYGGGYSYGYSRPYYSGGYGYDRGYRDHDRRHWDDHRGHDRDRDRNDHGGWDRDRR